MPPKPGSLPYMDRSYGEPVTLGIEVSCWQVIALMRKRRSRTVGCITWTIMGPTSQSARTKNFRKRITISSIALYFHNSINLKTTQRCFFCTYYTNNSILFILNSFNSRPLSSR
ncbi:hypothetical protein KP509_39G044600 [Ceratopteris richardii]|uniref:Uncharacterized protein n=1 Tax=Ceratopteris richardii TaxID=49495 RepID=A0A8T2Q0W8_CERRI|nr:hypothetical protein KP509_39G044600 [Ceratopteris richardii]